MFSNRHCLLTIGAHARRGLQELVCLSVRLSVCLYNYAYFGTTGYEAANEQYQQLQNYASLKNKETILLKRLRSRAKNRHGRGPSCMSQPINLFPLFITHDWQVHKKVNIWGIERRKTVNKRKGNKERNTKQTTHKTKWKDKLNEKHLKVHNPRHY